MMTHNDLLEKQALTILDEKGCLSDGAMSIYSSYISGTVFILSLIDDKDIVTEYTFKMDIDIETNLIKVVASSNYKVIR